MSEAGVLRKGRNVMVHKGFRHYHHERSNQQAWQPRRQPPNPHLRCARYRHVWFVCVLCVFSVRSSESSTLVT